MTSNSIIFKLWKPTEEKRLKNNVLLFNYVADSLQLHCGNKPLYNALKRDYCNYLISAEIAKRELEELKNESTNVIKST